jgi:hypothetical protein
MSIYRVTDSDGNVSRIVASEEFAKAQYASYELEVAPAPATPTPEPLDPEKEWRDQELQQTDWIVQTPDYPNRDAYLTYRQELRDWPSTEDFPDTRPELGS